MDLKEFLGQSRGRRSLLQAMGVAAVGISFGGLAACGKGEGKKLANGEEPKLNFYNWDTYIGETTLDDFKASTGVDVTMDLFDSNDTLFAKFKAGNPGYDVIVPSNDFVERMARADMLMPLDHAQIPNMKNIDPSFLNVDYDPGRKFSMPYTWLVLGIGYRKSKVKVAPDSWKVLFDSDEYKGRMAWLSCPRKAASSIRIRCASRRARRIRRTPTPSSTICSMPRSTRRSPKRSSTRPPMPPRRH